jgi:hypothetical protein
MQPSSAILWPVLVGLLVVSGGGEATASYEPPPGAVMPVVHSQLPSDTPPTVSGARPENGARLIDRGARGHGVMVISNGTSQDGVVTLAMDSKANLAVYVRANSDARVESIGDGTYTIYVRQGTAWNGDLRKFTADAHDSKFESTAQFTTIRDANGIQYTEFSITLQPVEGGNARSVPVDADEIPE